jgi:hypothetical protein
MQGKTHAGSGAYTKVREHYEYVLTPHMPARVLTDDTPWAYSPAYGNWLESDPAPL